MSWRYEADEDCDMFQALYRDDGEPLGFVLRLCGGEDTYAYTATPIGLRPLGARWRDEAVRRAVERDLDRGGRAIVIKEVETGVADSGARTPFRPDTPRAT